MNIKEKFLELTSKTYPHKTEDELFPLFGEGFEKDEIGNFFVKIGESDVMFTSHLDTSTSALTKVNHVIEGNIIKTDGGSILGADDKAGVVVMLYMIENKIPGLYYFFVGEEVGCVGSRKVADAHKLSKLDIKKVISFDRRGTDSVITFQSFQRCCSEKFGEALAKELNDADLSFKYKNDPTGSMTDSIRFTSIYPECTNISVGYQSEHTHWEEQDIEHLEKLANACLKVKWTELPVERDPSKIEYRTYDYTSTYSTPNRYGYNKYDYGNYDGNYDDFGYNDNVLKYNNDLNKFKPTKVVDDLVWFYDKKFEYLSNIKKSNKGVIISVDFCKDRIRCEQVIISDLLKSLDVEHLHSNWDGFRLKVFYKNGEINTADRNDLLEYLPEFDYTRNLQSGTHGEELAEDYTGYKEDVLSYGYNDILAGYSGL